MYLHICLQALEIYEGAFGRDHFLVAKELDALVVLYQKQGKHDQAEPLRKRAVSIRKKTRTPRVTSVSYILLMLVRYTV